MKKLVAVILTLTLLLAAAAVPGLAASTLTPRTHIRPPPPAIWAPSP